ACEAVDEPMFRKLEASPVFDVLCNGQVGDRAIEPTRDAERRGVGTRDHPVTCGMARVRAVAHAHAVVAAPTVTHRRDRHHAICFKLVTERGGAALASHVLEIHQLSAPRARIEIHVLLLDRESIRGCEAATSLPQMAPFDWQSNVSDA